MQTSSNGECGGSVSVCCIGNFGATGLPGLSTTPPPTTTAPTTNFCQYATQGNGGYCGSVLGHGANINTVYTCTGGTTTTTTSCASSGCQINPSGSDYCIGGGNNGGSGTGGGIGGSGGSNGIIGTSSTLIGTLSNGKYDCAAGITGWACDKGNPTKPVQVDLYDGPYVGNANNYLGNVLANQKSSNQSIIDNACGDSTGGPHWFTFSSSKVNNGNTHNIYAYVHAASGNSVAAFGNDPQSLTCPSGSSGGGGGSCTNGTSTAATTANLSINYPAIGTGQFQNNNLSSTSLRGLNEPL